MVNRAEALDKIAWNELKKLSRDDAESIIRAFFNEPLKPSLREKLNITAVMQWETHSPPPDLRPGNPIYRPILIDRMKESFLGATNAYLADYLTHKMGLSVDQVDGEIANLLACAVCEYKTFTERGTWHVCPVCGWSSDPVQEAIPAEPLGSNGISLQDAQKNFAQFGAVAREKLADVDPEGRQKYPKEGGAID